MSARAAARVLGLLLPVCAHSAEHGQEMTPEELSVYGVDMDVDGAADISDDEGDVT